MAEKKLQPIIVKRIKKGGHAAHGGAWKIAYADFVTAMEVLTNVVLMLYPITPHVCFHLWQALGHADIDQASWPTADAAAMVEDEKLVVVQVNGKVRGKLTVAADATQEQVHALAMQDHTVLKFVADLSVRKVIYVPGKLLNIVVG